MRGKKYLWSSILLQEMRELVQLPLLDISDFAYHYYKGRPKKYIWNHKWSHKMHLQTWKLLEPLMFRLGVVSKYHLQNVGSCNHLSSWKGVLHALSCFSPRVKCTWINSWVRKQYPWAESISDTSSELQTLLTSLKSKGYYVQNVKKTWCSQKALNGLQTNRLFKACESICPVKHQEFASN